MAGNILPTYVVLREYPSKSNPGSQHEVRQSNKDGNIYCTCKQWTINKACSHLSDYIDNHTDFGEFAEFQVRKDVGLGDVNFATMRRDKLDSLVHVLTTVRATLMGADSIMPVGIRAGSPWAKWLADRDSAVAMLDEWTRSQAT